MIVAISSETNVMSPVADIVGRDKNIVYIDTASNGQEGDKPWLDIQVSSMRKEYPNMKRYSLEGKNISNFKRDLQGFDIIHIGGGNTAYLLFHVLKSGFDVFLKENLSSKVIIASSAGALILGKSIEHIQPLDDFSIIELNNFDALGFFNFDLWVHFGKQKYMEAYFETLKISFASSQIGIYIDDNSYLISRDEGKTISMHTV